MYKAIGTVLIATTLANVANSKEVSQCNQLQEQIVQRIERLHGSPIARVCEDSHILFVLPKFPENVFMIEPDTSFRVCEPVSANQLSCEPPIPIEKAMGVFRNIYKAIEV